jgi:hypothetical protein
MLKSQIVLLLLIIFSDQILAQNDESNGKPLRKFDVIIDSNKYSVNDGDTLKYDNKKIVIKISDFLSFDCGGLSFDFPKYFSYDFNQKKNDKWWILSGNRFVITYFEFGEDVELNNLLKDIIKKFGKRRCKLSDITIKIGEISLIGKRVDIGLLGEKIAIDFYPVNTNDSKKHFIAFQDSKNKDGSDSKESKKAMSIIDKTMKIE